MSASCEKHTHTIHKNTEHTTMTLNDMVPHGNAPDIDAATEGARVARGIQNAAGITYENAAVIANNTASNIKKAAQRQGLTIANAKQAAGNVADNIKNMADNHGLTVENAKNVVTNIPAAISRQPESHWHTIMPLFCASIITALLMGFHFTSPLAERGNLASLIPLVMIMGEPILSKALSVTTASPRNDCAHLGAGWLAWCLSAVVTALSNTTDLVAKPENNCKVMGLSNGHARANNSFILFRTLRDLENTHDAEHTPGGLAVHVMDAGKPGLSAPVTWRTNAVSIAVMLAQFCIALTAFLFRGDLNVLCFFGAAILAMESITNLPAWSATKFHARKDNGHKASFALMRGNGHRNVFVIRNAHPDAWNLEDMASGIPAYDYASTPELLVICLTAVTFSVLTLAATMIPAASIESILYILALGTLGNVLAAALPREHGIDLTHVETIADSRRVVTTLEMLEDKYPGAGTPLVREFFPAGLDEQTKKHWDQMVEKRKLKKDIAETFGVEQDVEAKVMEVQMEKSVRRQ